MTYSDESFHESAKSGVQCLERSITMDVHERAITNHRLIKLNINNHIYSSNDLSSKQNAANLLCDGDLPAPVYVCADIYRFLLPLKLRKHTDTWPEKQVDSLLLSWQPYIQGSRFSISYIIETVNPSEQMPSTIYSVASRYSFDCVFLTRPKNHYECYRVSINI